MSQVINLDRERRRRQGRRPALALVGVCSTASNVLTLALDACDPEDRSAFLERMIAGSYANMLSVILDYFEVDQLNQTRAVG